VPVSRVWLAGDDLGDAKKVLAILAVGKLASVLLRFAFPDVGALVSVEHLPLSVFNFHGAESVFRFHFPDNGMAESALAQVNAAITILILILMFVFTSFF
jgi:hypothetical protein